MNYLKCVNAPMSIFKDEKYNGKTDDVVWEYCGFNTHLVSKLSISYRSKEGDFIQYFPISDSKKLNNVIDDFRKDLAALGPDHTATIVDDNRDEWMKLRAEFKDSKRSKSDLILHNGFTIRNKTTKIKNFMEFVQVIELGKRLLMSDDVQTSSITIPCEEGTYEADINDINLILSALESVRSNSIKADLGLKVESPFIIS